MDERTVLGELEAIFSAQQQLHDRDSRRRMSNEAHELFYVLRQRADEGALELAVEAIDLAERYVRAGLARQEAVHLLRSVGPPDGEGALRCLAHARELADYDRAWTRESLWWIRRSKWAHEPVPKDEILLPSLLLRAPTSWSWSGLTNTSAPDYVEETIENISFAREVLEQCLPATVAEELDTEEWDESGYRWLKVPSVLSIAMSNPRYVTRDRFAAVLRECAYLGIEGLPAEGGEAAVDRFVEMWLPVVVEPYPQAVFAWVAQVDQEELLTPWAMDLAEQYVQRRTAVESAIRMLRWTINVSRSEQALRRIAADESVEAEMRELAADELPD